MLRISTANTGRDFRRTVPVVPLLYRRDQSRMDGSFEPERHGPVHRAGPHMKLWTDYSRAIVKNYSYFGQNLLIFQH